MARRRNREINIFNMSLLDILCGALGAFCFMMLALLPYYKPPGSETKTRENQRKTDELVKQLDQMQKQISNPQAAEDLRKLVEELRKQIQEMQGELNQALAKNLELTKQIDELTARNSALTEENEKLKELLKKMTSADALAEMRKRIEALEQQLSLANAANQQLIHQNEELARRNESLSNEIQNRVPLTICVACDKSQLVDICLQELIGGVERVPFDPSRNHSLLASPDDLYFRGFGYSVYMSPKILPQSEYRLFLNLVTARDNQKDSDVKVSIEQSNSPEIIPPRVRLTPLRSWILYGTLRKDKNRNLTFTPATDAERDAIWEKITSTKAVPVPTEQAVPKPTSPDFPKPKPVPNTTPEPSPGPANKPKSPDAPMPPPPDSRVIPEPPKP